jgi:hypothetical protein
VSIKHTWARTIKNDAGGTVVAESTVVTATAEENLSEPVPASSTVNVVISVDVSQIQSFFIRSNKALTLKTNDDGSPDQTISLAANVALAWNAVDSLGSNPLTADITKLTFVNAGLVDAVVTAGFLLNL